MAQQDPSVSERTAEALKQLQPVAAAVEVAAAELSKPVSAIETALKRMNIAYEAWSTYKQGGHEEYWWKWDIGYTRIGNRWGIAIKVSSGDETDPEHDRSERWLFNESPLYLRHPAIDKLPDMLEALAKTGETVAGKLNRATERALTIAEVIAPTAKK
jgi:hypothetical protein